MEAVTYLDTHATSWLFSARLDLFPQSALARIEASRLLISPAVHLELQYLYEIGRIRSSADEVVGALRRELALEICDLPFPEVVSVALAAAWTRDPFDRLIAGQSALREAPLLTKDRHLHAHCSWARWKWADSPDSEAEAAQEKSSEA